MHESGEDYLEAILVLINTKGTVRSIDVADYFGYSKPSISRAVAVLRSNDFLEVDADGLLHLTESGKEIAKNIYERHCFFRQLLIDAGVEPGTADKEACKMEHGLSRESFKKLRKAHENNCENDDS
jgi:Mn-dependent DtxR family transcriptional regulator